MLHSTLSPRPPPLLPPPPLTPPACTTTCCCADAWASAAAVLCKSSVARSSTGADALSASPWLSPPSPCSSRHSMKAASCGSSSARRCGGMPGWSIRARNTSSNVSNASYRPLSRMKPPTTLDQLRCCAAHGSALRRAACAAGVIADSVSCSVGMSAWRADTLNLAQSSSGSNGWCTKSPISSGTQPANATRTCRWPCPPPVGARQKRAERSCAW
mmetsp:Transcript_29587/g.87516  ORF Transcript_29587/g.87516 Transcript_29587/m.87516 type:complete len:215 (-) Transcript_29587:667-1311(-)